MDELIKFLAEHPEKQIEFTFHTGGENDILNYPYIVLRITNKEHFAIRYILTADWWQHLNYILTDLCERLDKDFLNYTLTDLCDRLDKEFAFAKDSEMRK